MVHRAIGFSCLVTFLLGGLLPAQGTPTPQTPAPVANQPQGGQPGGAPARPAVRPAEEVDQQIVEMRRQMTEGRTYRSHVRVTVRLKNGNKMNGIVKDGFVVERIDGMRFVAAEASEPGAGMRLYYWNGKGNYVFLPFEDIQDYRINSRISSAELAAIEREAKAKEAEERARNTNESADAAAAAAASSQPLVNPAPVAEGSPTGVADPQAGVAAELQTLFSLLQEYPPTAGWSEQKRDEISHRKAVLGIMPSPTELKFVEKFADWQRACALFGAKPATPAESGTGGDAGDDRSRRRGRK